MDYTQTVTYLLYGVAGLGVLLALIVLVMALIPPKLEDYEDDEDFGEFKGRGVPYDEYDEYDGYDRTDEYDDSIEDETNAYEIDDISETIALPDPSVWDDEGSSEEKTGPDGDKPNIPQAPPHNQDISDTASIPVTADEIRAGKWKIRISSAQDIGARDEQQDAIEIGPTDVDFLEQNGFLCVLCDGMGGMRMGGDAAQLAARAFMKECQNSDVPLHTAMIDAVYAANERVWALCRTDDLSGAGTTLVAACINNMGLSFVSVGDSHIYLLRDGTLSQLNIDHNYLTELLLRVRQGEITRQQALSDPERAHLTSYLGVRSLSLVDRSGEPLGLESGDTILLASDGLFKVLTQKEIASYLHTFTPRCANRLIDDVLRRRYRNQDNVSVIVINIE